MGADNGVFSLGGRREVWHLGGGRVSTAGAPSHPGAESAKPARSVAGATPLRGPVREAGSVQSVTGPALLFGPPLRSPSDVGFDLPVPANLAFLLSPEPVNPQGEERPCNGGEPRPLVLVVDDVEDMRAMASEILSRAGYRVEEASTAREALEMVRSREPQVVLLDTSLPGEDVVAVLRQILLRVPSTSVVVSVSVGYYHRVIDALRAGARDFVPKPFTEGRLLEAMQRLVG